MNITSLILPGTYTQGSIDVSITLTGTGGNANAGSVASSAPVAGKFTDIGPLILPTQLRQITAISGSVDVFLLGAQANAQGEELEGADVTVYLDGARARGQAQDPVFETTLSVSNEAIINVSPERTEFESKAERTQFSFTGERSDYE